MRFLTSPGMVGNRRGTVAVLSPDVFLGSPKTDQDCMRLLTPYQGLISALRQHVAVLSNPPDGEAGLHALSYKSGKQSSQMEIRRSAI